jgi:hypothetical protein
MSPVDLVVGLVYGGLLALGAGFPIASAARHPDRRARRRIKRAKPLAIGRLAPGIVRVSGRVEAINGELARAPVTGQPCVACTTIIKSVADTQSTGPTILRTTIGVRFRIADDSGATEIDPIGADVFVVVPQRQDFKHVVPGPLVAYLRANGQAPERIASNRFLYFEERRIVEGATVTVAGVVEEVADPRGAFGGDYRESPTVMRFGGRLAISDDPADR